MIHFNEPVARIDVWYDRQFKVWYVTEYNKDGDQIGTSEDHYFKADAVSAARRRARNFNPQPRLRTFTRAGDI